MDSFDSEEIGSPSSFETGSSNSSTSGIRTMNFQFPTALTQRRQQHKAHSISSAAGTSITIGSHYKRRKRKSCFRNLCGRLSTAFLVSSFLLWVYVTFFGSPLTRNNNRPIRDRVRDRTAGKSRHSGIIERFWNDPSRRRSKRTTKTEDMLPGCEPAEWHSLHYPTCNDVHSYRLGAYLASGLWRDVWLPSDDIEDASVLKMMKDEHEVTTRNWDRHRRDALVMEQLTASPYVVDIYGYCANTVLTERISPALDELVIEPEKGIAPLKQRIAWARDMARGIAELHERGIVHADIQAKQFLWDRENQVAKINDFNRCRFLAHPSNSNTRGEFCSMRIPSAPGKQRSPEEYDQDMLTEKLDVYSYANILMALWTGHKAWDDYGSAEAKRLIQRGFVPPSPFKRKENDPIAKQLWNLTATAYALDPAERPSAQEIASVLDRILEGLE